MKVDSIRVCIDEIYREKNTVTVDHLNHYAYPWNVLADIGNIIVDVGIKLNDDYIEVYDRVWVHKTAEVQTSVYIEGPCIIGERSEVRHCSYIRGNVIVGNDCVVGGFVELKNSILFDGVQLGHYNYVGDSILGYKVHLGAGAITSNLKLDRSKVVIHNEGEKIDTGLLKVGVFLGDRVDVGTNSVLNPGTVVGPNSIIYPLSNVRGIVPANSIYKNNEVYPRLERE